MSEEIRYKKLGVVKQKDLDADFDSIYDKYKSIALELGLTGDLKFVKEKGKVIIYIAIWHLGKTHVNDRVVEGGRLQPYWDI